VAKPVWHYLVKWKAKQKVIHIRIDWHNKATFCSQRQANTVPSSTIAWKRKFFLNTFLKLYESKFKLNRCISVEFVLMWLHICASVCELWIDIFMHVAYPFIVYFYYHAVAFFATRETEKHTHTHTHTHRERERER